jgi:type VI secretion system protein ImpE
VTPHEALAEGRLADALALQEVIVAADPDNPAARRLLVDLLAFAGRLGDALDHLSRIRPQDPEWPTVESIIHNLFRAERARSVEERPPQFIPRVEHSVERWRAIEALRAGKPEDAVAQIDRADAVSPHLRCSRRFEMGSTSGIPGRRFER